jgi:hypothetical protein
MNKLKQLLSNDIVERALKTFAQTFLATLAVGVLAVDNFEGVLALLTGALAAAISATWNSIKRG